MNHAAKLHTLHTWMALLLALCVVCVTPSHGFAQDAARETADITDRQVDLNEDGVRAIIDGDYTKAVALLSESLAYGEANVTYLNLGRAYQKKGDCENAREALEKVATAPVVDDPPPRIVEKQANKYLAELDQSCPKEQEPPPTTDEQATADDTAEDESAEEAEQTEKAGNTEHEAEEEVADQGGAQRDEAPSESTSETEPDAPQGQDVQMAKKNVEPNSGGSNALGWAAIGSGAALAGGGVVLHFLAEGKRDEIRGAGVNEGSRADVIQYDDQEAQQLQDQANLYDTIGLSAGIAGAALVGVGTVALLTNRTGESALRLKVGPDRAMAVARWRF